MKKQLSTASNAYYILQQTSQICISNSVTEAYHFFWLPPPPLEQNFRAMQCLHFSPGPHGNIWETYQGAVPLVQLLCKYSIVYFRVYCCAWFCIRVHICCLWTVPAASGIAPLCSWIPPHTSQIYFSLFPDAITGNDSGDFLRLEVTVWILNVSYTWNGDDCAPSINRFHQCKSAWYILRTHQTHNCWNNDDLLEVMLNYVLLRQCMFPLVCTSIHQLNYHAIP